MVQIRFLMIVVSLLAAVKLATRVAAEDVNRPQTCSALVRDASQDGRLVTASAEELEAVRQLFTRTFFADDPSTLTDDWADVEMELQRVPDPLHEQGHIWVIRESEHARRGRGVYAVRPQAKFQYALEMPHSFHDRYTREIGLRLFQKSSLTAAAWNTIERTEVDLAHVRFHYFNSFTTAFTDAHPSGVVIQLHGFAKHKRAPDALDADCIVSNGTRNPPDWVGQIAQKLDTKIEGYSTLLFPSQIDDLGATTNRQAKLIYGNTTASFLHVEMSQPLRDALRRKSDLHYDFFSLILKNCRR